MLYNLFKFGICFDLRIIGPLPFLIYVEDLAFHISADLTLSANDTILMAY